tara:strand:- start:5102 stop:5308 length:207 start_codon:yes stop_codon:yes gene_type:complete
MESNEFVVMTIIAGSLSVGFLLGAIASMAIGMKENKKLQEEVDKFRDLYFEELDKWKDKYKNDDYEAY